MKKIFVSASQIDTVRSCKRKWAFDKLGGLRSPPTPAMLFGTEAHAVLENWGKEGTEPDDSPQGLAALRAMATGEVHQAESGIYYEGLARDGTGLEGVAEDGKFQFSYGGTWFHGYIDYCDNRETVPKIRDYKFTSSLKWAPSEEELRHNTQCILYSMYAVEVLGATEVDFGLIFTERKDTWPSRTVKVTLSADEVRERFESSLLPVAQWIVSVRKRFDQRLPLAPHMVNMEIDAAEHAGACDKYGGCPYLKDGTCDGRGGNMGLISGLGKDTKHGLAKLRKERLAPLNEAKGINQKEPTPQNGEPPRTAPAPTGGPARTVYLDCVPVGVAVPYLEQVLGPVINVDGPWDAPMSGTHYTDLKGGARAEIAKFLASGAFPPFVIANSQSDLWRMVKDLLLPAAFIIKGI